MFDFQYSVEAGEVESVQENSDGTFTLFFKNYSVTVAVQSVKERFV